MRQPPETLDIWLGLLRTQTVVLEHLESSLDQDGIGMGWYEVLAHLCRSDDGAMRMQDLAEQILLSKSGLTRLADRIEEAGDIERRSCPTDRRGTFAVVTAKGRERYERLAPTVWRALEEHFETNLTATERAVLRKVFDRLSQRPSAEVTT